MNKCEDCKYWDEGIVDDFGNLDKGHGICRIYPPQPLIDLGRKFPVTSGEHDWCGKYEADTRGQVAL